MEYFLLIVLSGVAAVLIFDTVGSFASRRFNFNYAWLSFGSFLIYGSIGFATSKYNALMYAPFASAIVSLIDATMGWYISWVIGPGRVEMEMNSTEIVYSVAFVVGMGSIFGFIGGFLESVI